MKESAAKQQIIRDEDVSHTDPTMPLPDLSHLLEENDAPAPPAPNGETSLTADLTIECLTRLIELMGVMTQSVEKIAVMLEQQAPKTGTRSSRATKKKTTRKKATKKTAAKKTTARRSTNNKKRTTSKTSKKKATGKTATAADNSSPSPS